jgi:hypothetical protein
MVLSCLRNAGSGGNAPGGIALAASGMESAGISRIGTG